MSHHCDLCRRVCDCGYSRMECKFCQKCQKEMNDNYFYGSDKEVEEYEKLNALLKEDKTDETQL